VIINDLDIISVALNPGKADTPLVINTDAVLSVPVSAQSFKPISRVAHVNPAMTLPCADSKAYAAPVAQNP
jgi:glycerol uptake facilitator-like aquaporin